MAQKICSFCGARYDDSEKTCPYCGSENVEYSMREQEEILREFKEKRQKLNEEIPRERIRRAHGAISTVAAIMVILISVLIVIATVFSVMRVRNRRKNQMQTLDILEQYYQNRQFAEMRDYYYNSDDTYSATYDKYLHMSDIWYSYTTGKTFLTEDLEQYIKYQDGSDVFRDSVSYDLNCLFRSLHIMRELEDNGYVYNEREGVEYMREMVLETLKETAGLTQEQIDYGVSIYEDYNTDYGYLADEILGRND